MSHLGEAATWAEEASSSRVEESLIPVVLQIKVSQHNPR